MKPEFDWQKHPEIKQGEIFLTNSTLEDYNNIGWKTKRRGIVAYDINGNVIKGLFPVFILREEYLKGNDMRKFLKLGFPGDREKLWELGFILGVF